MFVEVVVVGIFFQVLLGWLFLTAWEEKTWLSKAPFSFKNLGKSEPGFVSRWVLVVSRTRFDRPTKKRTANTTSRGNELQPLAV